MTVTLLISPTEPLEIRVMGQTSSVPEDYGVDVLWITSQGIVGVQRKEVRDFINSAQDGRLGKELSQMKQLRLSLVIVEGTLTWTTEGKCMNVPSWSLERHLGVEFSIQSAGCWLTHSRGIQESIAYTYQFQKWSLRETHTSLTQRPNPVSKWGRADNVDWCIHLLQSFPGIGAKMAGQIYKWFGRVPLRWDCTLAELMDVPGIGPNRAANMYGVLNEEGPDQLSSSDSEEPYTDLSAL